MWKILVVDDEAMERSAIREVLEHGLNAVVDVRTAADGLGAVELAAIWQPDVVLMDIEMPGMNGVKSAGQILRTLPHCQVVFLTAYGLFEYAQEAIRLGVRDYILKPAEDGEIRAAVQRAIARLGPAAPEQRPAAARGDKNARLMQQVQAYLEANFQNDISLDSLATTLDFSPFYISKLFKQTFGVSFIEYLTDLRVKAAKEYLADPTKSVREVGELVGYPNGNYFVKMFKKKTGLTPTEYRNSL